jgi:hypothetical protein
VKQDLDAYIDGLYL